MKIDFLLSDRKKGNARRWRGSGRNRDRPAAAAAALLWLGAGMATAFPPAPYFTVFGDARDQYGLLIPAGSAAVVLYKSGAETMRTQLSSAAGADYNYQLRVKLDMLRESSAAYSSKALSSGTVFTLGIESGGQTYYPIEMATPPTVGSPAARRRLNLTLGVDADGDGLPDAWEESQLHQGGIAPGENGWDLSLIDKDGDFDKDGVSNYTEYVGGTYAADAASTLDLKIKEKLASSARLEFYAIYGKAYTLESSTDLKTWTATDFSLSAPDADPPGTAQSSLTSTTTGVVSVYAAAGSAATYYRLHIR